MKKKKWIYIVLFLLCVAAFVLYRMVDGIRTDNKAPEIQFGEVLTISVNDPEDALFRGVKAEDDRDGNVTSSVVVESITMADPGKPARVVYAAFDKAGNVAKAERELIYTDYSSPKFHLSAPLLYVSGNTFDVLDRVQANDVLEGDISQRVRATAMTENSIANIGVHDVQFRVTNSLGDTVNLVLPVEVYSAEVYRANLTLTDYLVYVKAGAAFNPRDYLYEFTILDESHYLRGSFPSELKLKISGSVDTNTPGVYAVSYTVTGELRETEYAGYSKLIVIVEG